MSVWDTPTQGCPYCGSECEADWVDVEVGMVQCGPYYCENCGASEIGPEAGEFNVEKGVFEWNPKINFTEKEKETGWYEPGKPVSPYANTVNGVLVDHETARIAYRLGLLDEKRLDADES